MGLSDLPPGRASQVDLADELTTATLGGRYDLFTGGARIYDMQGSSARVEWRTNSRLSSPAIRAACATAIP